VWAMEYRLTKSHRCISIRPIAENKRFHAYKVWNEHFARRGFGPIWMVVYDGMYNLRAPGARPQKVLWHYAKFRKNDIEYFRAQNDRYQCNSRLYWSACSMSRSRAMFLHCGQDRSTRTESSKTGYHLLHRTDLIGFPRQSCPLLR
jgi:hypothetical protein